MRLRIALAVLVALIVAVYVDSSAHADSTPLPDGAYLGSTDWLATPASVVAGQDELVYCNLPADSFANWMTGLSEDTPGGPWSGHLIWGMDDQCQLLWHPRTRDDWWLAGHAAEGLAHEIGHDARNLCGDKAADQFGVANAIRVLQTILGYRQIRVHPKQRRWALAGARAEASGPVGPDPINPGCWDYGA